MAVITTPKPPITPPCPATDSVLERLLLHRTVHLSGTITPESADRVTSQLLLLAAESDADIHLYINSPGGLVTAGMAIYDTMQHIPNDVATTGLGFCASMGQFLLTAGAPGKRSALPHTRMMLHLPALTPTADRTASANRPEELDHHRARMTRLLAHHTRRTSEQILIDLATDRWFTPTEARAYRLIDHVLPPTPARTARC
ncbi:ClpP family protease [Streptomyces sp. enrichment culture]|uniref:ClpP family protease n=1 Tax=Streptomyces sp. enrichment culture TaxID=1795815 RepID=UPI003F565D4D